MQNEQTTSPEQPLSPVQLAEFKHAQRANIVHELDNCREERRVWEKVEKINFISVSWPDGGRNQAQIPVNAIRPVRALILSYLNDEIQELEKQLVSL
ncbi:MAG: hypothetical protein ACTHMC_01615 [Pseudobacter sp.]|uniref:hypothetical protein n=1 Tax=Pseudobacter sp. TaxID=2045420 RepID=UPI003F7E116E